MLQKPQNLLTSLKRIQDEVIDTYPSYMNTALGQLNKLDIWNQKNFYCAVYKVFPLIIECAISRIGLFLNTIKSAN
uniref:Putative ovule protein n=1 Tax=Solanum chacoense TaxID=4108 RepID=A0A0V0GUC8_SOLCH